MTDRARNNDAVDYLEYIRLNEKAIYFNRMTDMPANYYHWHQCVEILAVSQGVGIALVEHQQYTVKPGRLFIFPPGKLHKVYVEQNERNRYHRTTIHFNSTLLEQYCRDFPRQQALLRQLCGRGEKARVFDVSAEQDAIEALLLRFEKWIAGDLFSTSDSAFLVMQLLSLLPEQQQASGKHTFSTRLIGWIEEHYQSSCSLQQMADAMGCSRGHTSRRFHDETGGTLQEYLVMRRLRQACELLLQSRLSVREIARLAGFTEYAWFITCFKKHMGKTPLQYRKAHLTSQLSREAVMDERIEGRRRLSQE